MAACGSLHRYFENPMPENPTLIEALAPWGQVKSVDLTSFTELFRELQFKEKLPESSSCMDQQDPPSKIPQSSFLCKSQSFDSNQDPKPEIPINRKSLSVDFDRDLQSNRQNSMNSKNSSLGTLLGISNNHCMCTEGLGFESCDDLEDSKSETADDWVNQEKERLQVNNFKSELRNSSAGGSKRSKVGDFPPPISCIGRNGQPWVCFKSYRHGGRFILREYRIPTQEFLHASREDGRLKLHLVQRDEAVAEEEEEEEEDDDDDEEQEVAEEEQEGH